MRLTRRPKYQNYGPCPNPSPREHRRGPQRTLLNAPTKQDAHLAAGPALLGGCDCRCSHARWLAVGPGGPDLPSVAGMTCSPSHKHPKRKNFKPFPSFCVGQMGEIGTGKSFYGEPATKAASRQARAPATSSGKASEDASNRTDAASASGRPTRAHRPCFLLGLEAAVTRYSRVYNVTPTANLCHFYF